METEMLTARVKHKTMEKIDELVREFQKDTIGGFSRRAVIEKAIDELHQKYFEGGEKMANEELRKKFKIVWKMAYIDNDPEAKAIIQEIEKAGEDQKKERVTNDSKI